MAAGEEEALDGHGVEIWVIDAHRPWNLENVFGSSTAEQQRDGAPIANRYGLLNGKTVNLKDNIAVKGVPCLLGTEVFTDWTPNMDATVVTRVLEAGGIIDGKAVD